MICHPEGSISVMNILSFLFKLLNQKKHLILNVECFILHGCELKNAVKETSMEQWTHSMYVMKSANKGNFGGFTGTHCRCKWMWGSGRLYVYSCWVILVTCPALLCSSLSSHTLYMLSTSVLLCPFSRLWISSKLIY